MVSVGRLSVEIINKLKQHDPNNKTWADYDPDPARPLKVKLTRGSEASGRLLRPDGQPAAGVWLTVEAHCHRLSNGKTNHRADSKGRQRFSSYSLTDIPNWDQRVQTDAEGRFRVTVPPSKKRVWLQVRSVDPKRLSDPAEKRAQSRFAPLRVKFNGHKADRTVPESETAIDLGTLRLRPTPVASAAEAAPPNSLVVILQDKVGNPIPNNKMRLYNGQNVWRGAKAKYEMEFAETDESGRAVFSGLFDRIGRAGYWLEIYHKEGAEWRTPARLIGRGTGLMHAGDPLIATRETTSGGFEIAVTLREECPTDIEIIDATTGKWRHRAQLLFRDRRVDEWTVAARQDYAFDGGDDPGRMELDFFTTIVPEMSDAQFMATHQGFYPVEFQLDEELTPDKTLRRRIELKPAPYVELTINDSRGRPVVGAKLEYLGPKARGPIWPVRPSDENGRIQLPYPEFGRFAHYQIEHGGETAEFSAADFPEPRWQKGEKPRQALLVSDQGWALIRHTVQLAAARVSETTEAAANAPPQSQADNSLVVILQDKEGQPIPGVKLRVYDGNSFWGGNGKPKFKLESAVSDASGRASFSGLFDRIPKDASYWIQFSHKEGATWRAPKRLVGGRTGLTQRHDQNPLTRTEEKGGGLEISVTLREVCPADIEIVNSMTGERQHWGQLLFKDDRVKDWTIAAFNDYVGDPGGDDPARLGLVFFTTVVSEMSDARFMATHEGYYPVEFRLSDKLRPDKTLRQRVELKPAPYVELTINDSRGRPVVGAKLEYLGPKARGSMWPVKPSDGAGRISLPYPELGRLARYRIEHERESAEFSAADFPEPQWQKSEKPERAQLVNTEGWALIRHTVRLAAVGDSEAPAVATEAMQATVTE